MPKKSKPRKQAAAKRKSQPKANISEPKSLPSSLIVAEKAADQGYLKSFRAIPNIPDLANRGGLNPSDGSPFRLGAFGDDLTMNAHGANTLSMVAFVARTWEKDVYAARQICIAHPEVSPSDIEERYSESFRFMGRKWIERNIIDRKDATDHREMAHEIDDKLRSYPTIGPALLHYPVPEHDTRPYPVQQGEIVARYYEQMQKMRQASRLKPLSEHKLRDRFPDFEVWSVMHKMAPYLKAQLFGVGFASIGNANAGRLFDCIGSILGVAGSTAQGWFKEYRDFHGLKRHRRPAKVASPQTS